MPLPEARLRQLRDVLPHVTIEGAGGVTFHLHELLGEGGQGWVYRASYDEPDGPWVVVKLLRPDVVNEEALARFLREADVLRKLGQAQAPCPMVVRFYDHGVSRVTMPDGEVYSLPFTVLEYVHGTNLAEILARTPGKGLPVARVRRLFRQLSRALETIHAAQIVHRDLKPSNVLVAEEGGQDVAKLTDFGLVKRFDVDVKGTMALAGASIGYAPPEQFEMGNKRVSPRTDLFSFAAVLYESLAGKPAFPAAEGDGPFQALSHVLSGPRPRLEATRESLAPELAERTDALAVLDREIARGLSADPSERPESVRQFWESVEPVLRNVAGTGTTAKIPIHGEPSRTLASRGPIVTPSIDVASPARDAAPPTRASRDVVPSPSTAGFRTASMSLLPERARAMSISPDGHHAIALGRSSMYRWDGGAWAKIALPPGFDAATAHGVLAGPAAEAVVFGEHGLVAAAAEGALHPWAPPEIEIVWRAATLAAHEIVLVGDHALRRPVVASLRAGQPLAKRIFDGTAKLHAAARLASGALLACGDGGELVHVAGTSVRHLPWGRTGHLLAITPTFDGGAYIVGTGGHALWITPSLEAKLEPVQTTRDLLSVTASPSGVGWAGAADARLVRRSPMGWVRVPLPAEAKGAILAVHASPRATVCMLDDGMILEGPPS